MTLEERKKVTPRNVFFAGKAAPGCKYLHAINDSTEFNGLQIISPNWFVRRTRYTFGTLTIVADHSLDRQCRTRAQC